jgi:hypothetical protein
MLTCGVDFAKWIFDYSNNEITKVVDDVLLKNKLFFMRKIIKLKSYTAKSGVKTGRVKDRTPSTSY